MSIPAPVALAVGLAALVACGAPPPPATPFALELGAPGTLATDALAPRTLATDTGTPGTPATDMGAAGTPATDAQRTKAVAGHVERFGVVVKPAGLRGSLRDAGVPPSLLDEIDAALTTRLDLYTALGVGDALTVWLDRDEETLVAVELPAVRRAGTRLLAARYQGALASPGFYDEEGFSLKGPLRARPVSLSRVSSRFGDRLDPLDGATRKHRGVDFAVPVGSDVLAAGAGRVKARGHSRTAGRFIKVAHAGGYESWYLHLSRFMNGTEVGAVVEQGQVIAQSGDTGRSTGPHVHYELRLAGEALDPQRTMPIPEVALGPLALRQHRALIEDLLTMEERR